MRIFFPPNNAYFPGCHYCHQKIDQVGIRSRENNYYHIQCVDDILAGLQTNVDHIIRSTHNHNAAAYTTAQSMKRKLYDLR